MPFVEQGPVRIHYEEVGAGFPLLLLAPGGLNSALSNWSRMAAFNPMEVFRSDFRVIAMDQRNAPGGESIGPVDAAAGWDGFLADQVGLLDQLGIDRFCTLGFCIGCSYAVGLAQRVPGRLQAAVLCQPIGHRPEDPHVMVESGQNWGKEVMSQRTDITADMVETLLHHMYRSPADFAYSVSRAFLKSCQTPLLVLPGNDRPHPHEVGVEIAELAPRSECLDPWKDSALIPQTVETIRAFLKRHNQ